MAAPAAVVAVKAALVVATDKRARTVVLSVLAALLVPFILIIVVLLCALSGTANHNTSAVNLTFHGGYLSSQMPAEYRMYIEKMQGGFSDLDGVLTDINDMAEGGTVDDYRVKSIFYALFFGADQPRMDREDYRAFADCFVTYEDREDEEGNTYTVAIPITDQQTIYENLSAVLDQSITMEDQTNAQRIYTLVKYGQALPAGNGLLPGEAMGDGNYGALMAEATKYIGWPYVWGGSSPSTSFDCSGFVSWVINHSGWNVGRLGAQGLYNICTPVSSSQAKPGDLIFFQGTYDTAGASHVGLYVGDGMMIHCGSPISYANINTSYWQQHFYTFARP